MQLPESSWKAVSTKEMWGRSVQRFGVDDDGIIHIYASNGKWYVVDALTCHESLKGNPTNEAVQRKP